MSTAKEDKWFKAHEKRRGLEYQKTVKRLQKQGLILETMTPKEKKTADAWEAAIKKKYAPKKKAAAPKKKVPAATKKKVPAVTSKKKK